MVTRGVERFEDLAVFKRARQMSKEVYSMTRAPYFQRDRALQDQMRRAAVSIMSNIAEGFERYRERRWADSSYMRNLLAPSFVPSSM